MASPRDEPHPFPPGDDLGERRDHRRPSCMSRPSGPSSDTSLLAFRHQRRASAPRRFVKHCGICRELTSCRSGPEPGRTVLRQAHDATHPPGHRRQRPRAGSGHRELRPASQRTLQAVCLGRPPRTPSSTQSSDSANELLRHDTRSAAVNSADRTSHPGRIRVEGRPNPLHAASWLPRPRRRRGHDRDHRGAHRWTLRR